MKRLLLIALFFPLAALPQTVNHAMGGANGTTAMVTWSAAQKQNDTNIVSVSDTAGIAGAAVTDAAGDVYTQDCVSPDGLRAIYHANTQAAATNSIVLTVPLAGSLSLLASEQTGKFSLDTCGSGSGTSDGAHAAPFSATPAAPPQTGDLAYGFFFNSSYYSGFSAAAGFSIVNGSPVPWFGAGAYGYSAADAIGTGNPSFVYLNGTGTGSGQILAAWYKSVSAPAPVTLTFGPSSSALTPCTDTVSYDDGTSLFGQNPASFGIMELENGAWVNIGTPTVNPNNTVTGSVTVNPNYTDSSGHVLLTATIAGLASLPALQAQPIDPRQLEQGSTGICIGVVIFKTITLPKYSVLGLTP